MITLNLLPPNKKKDLYLTQVYFKIKNLIFFVFLIISIFAITLMGAKFVLQNFFVDTVDQSSLLVKNVQVYNEEIQLLSLKLDQADKIQKEHINWQPFIHELTSQIPENVILNSLTINEDKLIISGVAKQRNDLLNLDNNLKKLDSLSNINIPLDNLLKKEQVDFILKADLKLDKISIYVN